MNIRPATPDDFPKVMELIQSCIQHMESQDIHQWDEIYPDKAIIEQDIAQSELWVMEENNIICGMMVLNEFQVPAYQQIPWKYGGKILVVHRLAISPECQGRHLATQLMQFAEDYAAQRQYNAIRLDAFCKNPAAVHLYEKLNYSKAGIGEFRKGPFYCFEKRLQ